MHGATSQQRIDVPIPQRVGIFTLKREMMVDGWMDRWQIDDRWIERQTGNRWVDRWIDHDRHNDR